MDRVLILGSQGTLGGQLLRLCNDAVGWDRGDVDVRNIDDVRSRIASLDPTPEAIVNCVAFNEVDGAEDRPQDAFELNGDVPGALARVAVERRIPFVHFSTNYVFDGVKGEYEESEEPAPLSVYGESKRRGEVNALAAGDGVYVVRTAVIFGPKGSSDLSKKSFVDLMLDLSATRESLQVVSDEVNSLTYAPDLAEATRSLLERRPAPGIYHASNFGGASWFEVAAEIMRLAKRTAKLIPVPATHFPRKARRPAKAILRNTKLPPLRRWQDALEEFLSPEAS